MPYAELHCHSNFSFLDGASHPEELAEEAARLGLEALALTDHDGFYGVVRFAEAARARRPAHGVRRRAHPRGSTAPQNGVADPTGHHLVVLAAARTATPAWPGPSAGPRWPGRRARPGPPSPSWPTSGGGHWWVLTGCRKGTVPAALVRRTARPPPAASCAGWSRPFGRDHVAVELWDHGDPLDSARNDALAELAVAPRRRRASPPTTSTTPRRPGGRWPPRWPRCGPGAASTSSTAGCRPAAGAHLRSGAEQARRFARYPGVVERAAELGPRPAPSTCTLVAPEPAAVPVPRRATTRWRYLRAARRARAPTAPLRPAAGAEPTCPAGLGADRPRARRHRGARLPRLLPHRVGHRRVLPAQPTSTARAGARRPTARSATPSASPRPTPCRLGLLFERFLSPERDGPPDIDLDIESDRREEAIQYVYERYGRAARRPGGQRHHLPGQVGGARHGQGPRLRPRPAGRLVQAGRRAGGGWRPRPPASGRPRHPRRGAGPGRRRSSTSPATSASTRAAWCICDRPVIEVCPVEWGRMEDRSVLQWDKDDCAAVGPGEVRPARAWACSPRCTTPSTSSREHHGVRGRPGHHPPGATRSTTCCAGPTRSACSRWRAGPRWPRCPGCKPRDVLRPRGRGGPHPPRAHPGRVGAPLHPPPQRPGAGHLPAPAARASRWRKTLGVPLFQEQLMQMAIDVAGFTAGRGRPAAPGHGLQAQPRADGAAAGQRLYDGMAERGITGEVADEIFDKLAAFANYGFPESHSVSFAYLVYASSWIKLHDPAAFCAALLNAQPMGFYSPHSLVQDARRHGVEVRTPDLNALGRRRPRSSPAPASHRTGWPCAARASARCATIGDDLADAHRRRAGPTRDLEDLARRVPALPLGPARGPGHGRRLRLLRACEPAGEALWAAGAVAQSRPDRLAGIVTGADAPTLPGMTDRGGGRGRPVGHRRVARRPSHPVRPRPSLDRLGVVTAAGLLATVDDGQRVLVGGRGHPPPAAATAAGTTFINLEDETGLINVVCSKGCWARYRRVARGAPALLVRGRLETGRGGDQRGGRAAGPTPCGGECRKSRLSVTFVAIVANSTTKVTELKQETLVTRPTTPTEQTHSATRRPNCGGARRWCRSQVQSWPWR